MCVRWVRKFLTNKHQEYRIRVALIFFHLIQELWEKIYIAHKAIEIKQQSADIKQGEEIP